MKKKGVEKSIIIQLAVAGILLAIILIGFNWGSIYEGVNNLLPSFGVSREAILDLPQIRYDYLADEVEYYSGVEWKVFEGLNLGGVEVTSQEIKEEFNDYWYERDEYSNLREPLFVDLEGANFEFFPSNPTKIPELSAYFNKIDNFSPTVHFKSTGNSMISGFLIEKGIKFEDFSIVSNPTRVKFEENYAPIYAWFLINQEEFFLYYGGGSVAEKQENGANVNLINEKGKLWRNSIIENPIIIADKSYCPQEFFDFYLVVDLNNPMEECEAFIISSELEKDIEFIKSSFSISEEEILDSGKNINLGLDKYLNLFEDVGFSSSDIGKLEGNIIKIDNCEDIDENYCILLDGAKVEGDRILLRKDILDKWISNNGLESYLYLNEGKFINQLNLSPRIIAGYTLYYTSEDYRGNFYVFENFAFFEGGHERRILWDKKIGPSIFLLNSDKIWNVPGFKVSVINGGRMLVREGYNGFYYVDEKGNLVYDSEGEKKFISPYYNVNSVWRDYEER